MPTTVIAKDLGVNIFDVHTDTNIGKSLFDNVRAKAKKNATGLFSPLDDSEREQLKSKTSKFFFVDGDGRCMTADDLKSLTTGQVVRLFDPLGKIMAKFEVVLHSVVRQDETEEFNDCF